MRLDTWERGVGLTKACGTGACASALLPSRKVGVPPEVIVRPPFNQDDNDMHVLTIDYQPESHVLMRGPVAFEFDGKRAYEPAR